MNKQEALKRLEVQKETIIRLTGWAVYVYIEELIKSLDEPQPVKVPQFVAEKIEYFKKLVTGICFKQWILYLEEEKPWNGLSIKTTKKHSPVHGWTATRSRKRSGIQ